MAQIVIDNMGEKCIEVQDFSKTLLKHLQANGLDWMHACGGKGRCTTCKVRVLSGGENLEAPTEAELRYVKAGLLRDNERLACQGTIRGSVTIAVPEECKLPQVAYTY